ncbi:MAG: hypothetical protein PHV37_00450 [Candidatus Gastranaerophilales bacterium]|nr:hypothetical protein [Candidatus Gastranaerophilales bacterium]
MRDEYSENARRWYDKDPILSRSMKTLEESDDETQIKVALNLIKIIVEHNLSYSEYSDVEEIIEAVDEGIPDRGGRWYDIDKTLRTAINMLENCPSETQHIIAKEMAKIVIDKIKEDKDFENEADDELEDI